MAGIVTWNRVSNQNITAYISEKECTILVWKLTELPDFSESRFDYICENADSRIVEVAKRQLQMLREFHGLGSDWGISLRLIKEERAISLYLVFRYAGIRKMNSDEIRLARQRIGNALLQEYSFKVCEEDSELSTATDISWASQAAEIFKEEQEYLGDKYPTGDRAEFYAVSTWTAAQNNMEKICSALQNSVGKAVVEVTLVPTVYLDDERNWINANIKRMKECMNGERLVHPTTGKTLWHGEPIPVMKTPLDNYDKMNKQYEQSRMFLSAIRIFAEEDAGILVDAFMVNSVRNEGGRMIFRKGYGQYVNLEKGYCNVDISAYYRTRYQNMHQSKLPVRAQRLIRLVSLEEISSFFRVPIPIKPVFPGFRRDSGLGSDGGKREAKHSIRLGDYLDDASGTNLPAAFNVQQLAKHGLIVGVPGSGKTTAMFNILYQLWASAPEDDKIPFIIMEPAKTEYRALKTLPEFSDLLVFTLGDESVSPFRFNPMEVLPGIRLENHISKLQASFIGAFNLFDPLPIFLEQAIRRTYEEKGWYDDSRGGDPGLEIPTLDDLCRNAEYIINHSGFDSKMKSDFNASLLERLNSLRRGSKGRMLNTRHTIPMDELMKRPVVLELDSLNGDEKSLMMMFLLSYVFEYCKVKRKSGSSLKHMLLVEEAHNLISADAGGSDSRANPKAQTIELFVNMLAEMRALGQGILIADQLPTAIAPQAVKQTNVKVLMRVTAKDDREEIGNTMDLDEKQMRQVVYFKTGHAYIFNEEEDRVRLVRMLNFKGEHQVEEPPADDELKEMMADYEAVHPEIFLPYRQCKGVCKTCNRRVRNQAERFIANCSKKEDDFYRRVFPRESQEILESKRKTINLCGVCQLTLKKEIDRLQKRYGTVGNLLPACVYIHLFNQAGDMMRNCKNNQKNKKTGIPCGCTEKDWEAYLQKFIQIGETLK